MHGLGEEISHQVNVLITKLGDLKKVTQMTIFMTGDLRESPGLTVLKYWKDN